MKGRKFEQSYIFDWLLVIGRYLVSAIGYQINSTSVHHYMIHKLMAKFWKER